MNITCVIVEDEMAAREALKSYLGKYCPQVTLIGEAADFREAVSLIQSSRPQLVFLDVEMPFGNAFDVLEACKEQPFETIFVTAYSEYSLRALNMSAAYYLLKPLSIEELIHAVNKVYQAVLREETFNRHQVIINNFQEKKAEKHQLILPTLEGFEVVKLAEVVRFRANGNFTDVCLLNGKKKMVCRLLKYFSDMLPLPFIRVHKTHIVNTDFVKAYHKTAGGYIVMHDDAEVELSPQYKEAFLDCFRKNHPST